ncbi:MAG: glycosyltransferase [Elusimicrobia bacterium]|nr:glycosyltransferase [Elusimicrobiota bacterium]
MGKNRPKIDIVIPAYNEEKILKRNMETLAGYLEEHMPGQCSIIIVDNASRDNTGRIASELSSLFGNITCTARKSRGRGGAIREAWSKSTADVMCYMDADLSTGLDILGEAVDSLSGGGYDLAVASRLKEGARVKRSVFRSFISRRYNSILRFIFRNRQFSDAQCGFKAANRKAVEQVVPQVRDNKWFFDTELLVLSEIGGLRIRDIPADWNERVDTRVNILSTIFEDIYNIIRLRLSLLARSARK